MAPALPTKWQPVGPESCWGSAVSDACSPATSTQPMPAKASSPTQPPLMLLAGSKVLNGTGSADQVATRWAWILLGFCRFGCVLTGDVNPTNACQSFQPHPSTFAFSGFEGAKRHRLCRPSGTPLGLNPAGVLPFRMRAHRRRQPNQCLPKLPAPPIRL